MRISMPFIAPLFAHPPCRAGSSYVWNFGERHEYSSGGRICKARLQMCAVNARTDDATQARAVVERFWELTNVGDFTGTLDLFSGDAKYYDVLYPGPPFSGPDQILKHMENMQVALPAKKMRFVLDDIAAAPDRVGARWHVETLSGTLIPFGRGASMYSLKKCTSDGRLRISEAWDFPETPLKIAPLVLPVLRLVSTFLR